MEAAAEARLAWRRRPRPTVVAVDAPMGRSSEWARRVIDALQPTMVWGAVDATRKPEDLFEWAEQLGGFDALGVTDLDGTVSPAAVLQCGIPVGRLDGRDGHPGPVGGAARPPDRGLIQSPSLLFGETANPRTSPAAPALARRQPAGRDLRLGLGSLAGVPGRRTGRGIGWWSPCRRIPTGSGPSAGRPTGWPCGGPTPRGIGMLEATVTAATRAGIVPTWELVGPGPAVLFQRRRYARVPVVLPARAVGAAPGASTILDVAEGGIRCSPPQLAPFDPGESVEVSFDVDGLLLTARAEVVRWGSPRAG